jgi:hypothetical protein
MPLPLMTMPPHCCTSLAAAVPVIASVNDVKVIGAVGEPFAMISEPRLR